MTARMDWQQWVRFNPPRRLSVLTSNKLLIPDYEGFYIFTDRPGPLKPGNVLYVGETGMRGGIRARMGTYLIPDPKQTKTSHKGALFILATRLKQGDDTLWLRWAGIEIDRQTRQQIETAMIQHYRGAFNSRQTGASTSFDTF
ncbi:hypothetical protein [Actibacterium sp. 188UL27-1]|uniref:hypothetical protein n=1 Tax=Actibacterium sp. 188UL27-1 TaxID=2786961 RepID=UPI001955F7F1|nr:hypothetical protein [Actibacterium sp. 188UL27-1]MBM7068324.1 hypothetical protein [Actibacterium sp. 188UL27-1]